MTICVNCKGFKNVDRHKNIWYHHFCVFSPIGESIDPVTGKKVFMSENSLGMKVPGQHPYEYCRDVNTGNCEKFKEK